MIKRILILMLIFAITTINVYSVDTTNLTEYWPLDNTLNGNLGNIDLSSSNTAFTTEAYSNQAVNFSVGDSYLNTNNTDLDTLEGTYSIWVNSFGAPDTSAHIISDRINTNQYYSLIQGTNDIVFLKMRVAGGTNYLVYDNETLSPKGWTHYTTTWGSGGINLYRDGVLIDTNAYTGTWNSGGALRIGNQEENALQDYDWIADEVSVWSRQLNASEVLDLYQNGVGDMPPMITINSPTEDFNYTYDVSEVTLDLTTDVNTTCDFTYDNVTSQMSSTGTTSHIENFTMGTPINNTLTFDIEFSCLDSATNLTSTKDLTFYRQPEPLEFNILVPQDQQVFNFDTSVIEYHLVTNYVSTCEERTTNSTVYTPFTSTNNSVHKTNFTVNPEITTYDVNFRCYAPFVNDTHNITVRFYIDELVENGGQFANANTVIVSSFGVVDTVASETVDLYTENLAVLIIIGIFITLMTGLIAVLGITVKRYLKI